MLKGLESREVKTNGENKCWKPEQVGPPRSIHLGSYKTIDSGRSFNLGIPDMSTHTEVFYELHHRGRSYPSKRPCQLRRDEDQLWEGFRQASLDSSRGRRRGVGGEHTSQVSQKGKQHLGT